MYKLNESIKTKWALTYIKSTIYYSILAFLLEWLIIDEFFVNWPLPYLSLVGGALVIGILITAIMPGIRYKYWQFDIRPEELYIERGVFTRIRTTAPYVRIQHLDVRQGIIDRYLNLATLVVYTAGTRGADIIIPGLPESYAYELRDSLNNFTKEDGV
jgi:membrane protein YdbS with pleckstrin-like domain